MMDIAYGSAAGAEEEEEEIMETLSETEQSDGHAATEYEDDDDDESEQEAAVEHTAEEEEEDEDDDEDAAESSSEAEGDSDEDEDDEMVGPDPLAYLHARPMLVESQYLMQRIAKQTRKRHAIWAAAERTVTAQLKSDKPGGPKRKRRRKTRAKDPAEAKMPKVGDEKRIQSTLAAVGKAVAASGVAGQEDPDLEQLIIDIKPHARKAVQWLRRIRSASRRSEGHTAPRRRFHYLTTGEEPPTQDTEPLDLLGDSEVLEQHTLASVQQLFTDVDEASRPMCARVLVSILGLNNMPGSLFHGGGGKKAPSKSDAGSDGSKFTTCQLMATAEYLLRAMRLDMAKLRTDTLQARHLVQTHSQSQ